MSVLPFSREPKSATASGGAADVLSGFSIEVMPRTAAKIPDFKEILPQGTRVYVAHLEGTPFEDMLETAIRLSDDGFAVMPHVPARLVQDEAELELWIKRYAEEAGIKQALVLAGGPKQPLGAFHSSMQLLETGLFDQYGFSHLHVAGHPEGNKDIDPDGSTQLVDDAARWKQDFNARTDAQMALVTQFVFDAAPVLDWGRHLHDQGVDLPIHVGLAGPAKLQTLIKFAIACGVGPSLSVLQRRARDLSKLLLPFEPTDILEDLAKAKSAGTLPGMAGVHLFPLGGIGATARFAEKIANPAQQAPSVGG